VTQWTFTVYGIDLTGLLFNGVLLLLVVGIVLLIRRAIRH